MSYLALISISNQSSFLFKVCPEWRFSSDINLIEVALVGLDKELHPYALENKNCSQTFEDNTLIFKQHEPGVIYFRLTDEDYQSRTKT